MQTCGSNLGCGPWAQNSDHRQMHMTFRKSRDKGESFCRRVDRYRCIAGRCLDQIMSAKPNVTKPKTALKQ